MGKRGRNYGKSATAIANSYASRKRARTGRYSYSASRTRTYARRRNTRTAGFLGIENKFYDTAVSSPTSISSAAALTGGEIDPSTILTLSAPAQGNGEENRDGRQIVVTSVNVKGGVKIPAQSGQTGADDGTVIFVALVLDTQTNASQLSSEQVFINPSGSGNLSGQPMVNLQYRQRFKIIASKTFTADDINITYNGTNMSQQGKYLPFSFYKKCKTKVNFTDGNEGVASVTDNSYHIVAFTNSNVLGPQLLYNSRVRFVG